MRGGRMYIDPPSGPQLCRTSRIQLDRCTEQRANVLRRSYDLPVPLMQVWAEGWAIDNKDLPF